LPAAERGVTLLEVLIAIVLLSFGSLALARMMAMAIQYPVLAGYRSAAVNLAAAHADKIRANPAAFYAGDYSRPISYDGTSTPVIVTECVYPACTSKAMAWMDSDATSAAARRQLPAGGMLTTCDPAPCAQGSRANVWIMWREPDNGRAIASADADVCPSELAMVPGPRPRCVHLRFQP
jgi:type IV pilus assembly protein PilV